MANILSSIAALLRADFAVEADAGFSTVKRIPSTEAVKLLDYFAALEPDGRGPLLDVMARLGAMQFCPSPLAYQEALDLTASNPAIVQHKTALQSGSFAYGLRYQDLRMPRPILTDPASMARME